MERAELESLIEVGRRRMAIVDRRCSTDIPGYVQEVQIRTGAEVVIELVPSGYDEGGVTLSRKFDSLDDAVAFVEGFVGMDLPRWENVARLDEVPENCGDPVGFESALALFRKARDQGSLSLASDFKARPSAWDRA